MKLPYLLGAAIGCVSFSMHAASISLYEFAVNKDGTTEDTLHPTVLTTGLDTSGLGTATFSVGSAGDHYLALFVDHEIDEASNTFFNEFGIVHGTRSSSLSWQIDDPLYGTIYQNFQEASLNNVNSGTSANGNDVSMALGWNFNLAANQTALISMNLSLTAPSSGFYLEQNDPALKASIYFWSTLDISGSPGTTVPEPFTYIPDLSILGMLGLIGWRNCKNSLAIKL